MYAAYDDLSDEELELEMIGLQTDKIRYISEIVAYENPYLPLKNIYSAVGAALKRYSFRSVLLASKNIKNLESRTIFPRLIYACKSYHATEVSVVDTQAVVNGLKQRQDSAKLRDLLKKPGDTLFSLLMEGAITREQYQEASKDKEKCETLIREVVGND